MPVAFGGVGVFDALAVNSPVVPRVGYAGYARFLQFGHPLIHVTSLGWAWCNAWKYGVVERPFYVVNI